MPKILALDQASKTTGWAIFDGNNLIKYGAFTAKSHEIADKLVEIRNFISTLVKQEQITQVTLEDIALQYNVGNNVVTYKVLAEVIGVITEYLAEESIPFEVVAAEKWRAAIDIKGKRRPDKKKNAQALIQTTFGISVSEDEADAICIGLYACGKTQTGFDWSN